ncbi:nitrate- and nitrite sensing domain-containing protein [Marinomonas balearica]|uniref:Uncharacterized protein n=1 Tax=Marinomonas balearica TaxID=491947 RepID=A0A4R6MHU4_9GAMM|nr:nitrate- and nitrite sensing domain-containing protein [Marinomonas balearica]TDP01265.1 hypothetical protein DFP79_0167 [Marinomonas balearica]
MTLTLFIALSIIVGLSFLAVFSTVWSKKAAKDRAINGLEGLKQLIGIIKLIQQHRGIHSGYLNGKTDYKGKLASLETDIQHRFTVLKQFEETHSFKQGFGATELQHRWKRLTQASFQSSNESFRAHSGLISRLLDTLWDVSDKFGLTTHPDAAIRELAAQFVRNIPELTESIGQIRALSVQAASHNEVSADKKLQLLYTLSRIESRLVGLDQHFPERSIKHISSFIAVIRQGIENQSLRDQDPDVLFKEATEVIDQLYEGVLKGYSTLREKVIK